MEKDFLYTGVRSLELPCKRAWWQRHCRWMKTPVATEDGLCPNEEV